MADTSLVKLTQGWIRSEIVVAVFLGTPCSSFSLARNRPKGPPTPRTSEHPDVSATSRYWKRD
eukprot:3612963-Pyramimonas_sp.AAC.1